MGRLARVDRSAITSAMLISAAMLRPAAMSGRASRMPESHRAAAEAANTGPVAHAAFPAQPGADGKQSHDDGKQRQADPVVEILRKAAGRFAEACRNHRPERGHKNNAGDGDEHPGGEHQKSLTGFQPSQIGSFIASGLP